MVCEEHDELAVSLYDVGMEGSVWVVHLSLGFGADWHLVLLLCDCAGVAIFFIVNREEAAVPRCRING